MNLDANVYGPLYSLFEVSERYQTAVETIAGNSLFHVVVDTDETASRILDVMNKEKSGRITFMPLNRLNPIETVFPTAKDALPMIKKLNFNVKYSKAFLQVFGKAIICPSLDIASAYARNNSLNAVTMDGDRADKRGALTGGYQDTRKSRLDASRYFNSSKVALLAEEQTLDAIKLDVAKIQQESTQIKDKLNLLALNKEKMINQTNDYGEISEEEKESQRLVKVLESRKEALQSILSNINILELKLKNYALELKTPIAKQLTKEENLRLGSVTKELEGNSEESRELLEQITKVF